MSRLRGFTLIELLMVITIIGILTSVVLANMSGSRGGARDAKRVADLEQVKLVLETYWQQNKRYPGTSGSPYHLTNIVGIAPNYLSEIPVDPLPPRQYLYWLTESEQGYTILVDYEKDGSGACKIRVNNPNDEPPSWGHVSDCP